MRAAPKIELDAQVERELLSLTRKGRVEARTQQRARIVLLAAKGWQNKDIAAEVGLNRLQVALWRGRFLQGGIDALKQDAPRCGRPVSSVTAEVESLILAKTLHDKPISATHWSTRTLAAQLGLGPTSVRRVWSRNGLKPHRQTSFKLSRDPRFEDKLLDVVGLYLNPPERAIVLCIDEKSQVQALDRTAPVLPLRLGMPEKQTHDYVRHGTTTLFAALEVATGKVTDACYPRHRNEESLRFI